MDAIDRVLEMCAYWEILGKGEMPVTRSIKEAIEGTNEAQNERLKERDNSHI
jgi:hypothetical protein